MRWPPVCETIRACRGDSVLRACTRTHALYAALLVDEDRVEAFACLDRGTNAATTHDGSARVVSSARASGGRARRFRRKLAPRVAGRRRRRSRGFALPGPSRGIVRSRRSTRALETMVGASRRRRFQMAHTRRLDHLKKGSQLTSFQHPARHRHRRAARHALHHLRLERSQHVGGVPPANAPRDGRPVITPDNHSDAGGTARTRELTATALARNTEHRRRQ